MEGGGRFVVGNEGLCEVLSPRCLRGIDAGDGEEDEAAHDHRDDPADDHDESLVETESDSVCLLTPVGRLQGDPSIRLKLPFDEVTTVPAAGGVLL